jgi:hypothetical protein
MKVYTRRRGTAPLILSKKEVSDVPHSRRFIPRERTLIGTHWKRDTCLAPTGKQAMHLRSFSLQSSHYTDYEYIIPFDTLPYLIPSNDFGDENHLQRDERTQASG